MRRILGVVAVCAVGSSAFGQDVVPAYGGSTGGGGVIDSIVYDNSANTIGFLINGADTERGDGLVLDGTDREVTLLSVYIHSNGGDAIADIQARIYAGGDASGAEPCDLLWESDVLTQVTIFGGTTFYDFPVPNVVVPDEITWTLEMTNVTPVPGEVAGPRFIAPPVVGSSEDWVWTHDPRGAWIKNVYGVGAGNNSYGAYIEAVAGGTTSGCSSCAACACTYDPNGGTNCDIFDFLAFQNDFVNNAPCACEYDTTGGPNCDIFDFLAFQNDFVNGCP